MKHLLVICFISFSFVCIAQTNDGLIRDSTKMLLGTFKFSKTDLNVNVPNFNFKSSTRFTLYQNSISNYYVLYDNYRQEYKPIQPYSNFGSALIGGTLNTIFMLFEKKK